MSARETGDRRNTKACSGVIEDPHLCLRLMQAYPCGGFPYPALPAWVFPALR